MTQIPTIEMGYLLGVLAAFAAFALSLFGVALYVNLPHRPRVARTDAREGLVVRGEAVLVID